MARRAAAEGFLEKMLGPLPGQVSSPNRWVGDPVPIHLGLLLNTRQGSVPNLPDYGLPDVSSFYSDYPSSLGELRSQVDRLIRNYEPRLLNLRVKLQIEKDLKEFRASFLITGEIEEEEETTQVQYRTTISSSGEARVRQAAEED